MTNNMKIRINNINDIKLMLINELTSQGIAKFENNELELKAEIIYSISPTDRMLLGFPSYYPFTIEITNDGNVYKASSKLCYSFKEHLYGDYLFFERKENLLLEEGGLKYLLTKEFFNVCKLIERYNTFSGEETERYRLLSRISEIAKQNDMILPPSLQDSNISIINKLELDLKQERPDEDISFELKGELGIDKFPIDLDLNHIKPRTNFTKIKNENNINRIHFNDVIGIAISKIKQLNTFSKEDKISYLSKVDSDPELDADIIDLSKFSKRVIEYGYYKPRYFALVKAFKSEWIPGFSADKGDRQEITYIQNEEERIEFENSISKSLSANLDFIEYNNNVIPIKEAQELNNYFKKQLANHKTKPSNKEKKVLIIEENIDDLNYNEKSNDAKVKELYFKNPPNLKKEIKLLDYQKEGIAWLLSIADSYKGCLLADDMGLGKTLQILSFIDIYISDSPSYNIKILVIAPVSLLENWKNEYYKFFNPKLKVIITNSRNNLDFSKEKGQDNLFILTNYETVKNPKNQLTYGSTQWDIVIIDEAQKIKTPGTRVTNAIKSLKANFKIALTGTPVENSLLDVWSIIDFTSPGLLGSAKKFKDDFDKPLQKDFSSETLETVGKELRKCLGSSFKRRLKSDVDLALPEKKEIKKYHDMPEVQKNIYMEEVQQKEEGTPMLAIIQNLRNISDHPYLKHYDTKNFTTDELINSSAKLKITIQLLSEIKKRGEKVIVFTEFRKLQYLLRGVFLEYYSLTDIYIVNGLTATQETKSKESRQTIIDKFSKKNGFQIIIISPIAAGVGLNITAANNVIHYTRHWNPAKESQATDRVYRIGQNKPVNVYYPMSTLPDITSFDLTLDGLLKKKISLSDYTMFPTPITDVKSDDFNSIFNVAVSPQPVKLKKDELLKLDYNYLVSYIALVLKKRFSITVLTPLKNNKGIDIIGLNEYQTNSNHLIKIISPQQNFNKSALKDLQITKKYFEYSFNNKFNLIVIINNQIIEDSNGIETIEMNNLLNYVDNEAITFRELDKISLNRLNSLSDIQNLTANI